MSDTTNDKLVNDLNQIRREQENSLDWLNQIKENCDAELLPALESIENDTCRIIFEIDDLKRKLNSELTAQIERNTILARMSKPAVRTKIGSVWV